MDATDGVSARISRPSKSTPRHRPLLIRSRNTFYGDLVTVTSETQASAAEADIEQLRAEFDHVGAELDALIASLPPHTEEHPEPHINGVGMHFEPHRAWTEEERDQIHALRTRRRELAVHLDRARRQQAAA